MSEQNEIIEDITIREAIDGIYYVVLSHFDNAKDENMVEKVRRIVLKNG